MTFFKAFKELWRYLVYSLYLLKMYTHVYIYIGAPLATCPSKDYQDSKDSKASKRSEDQKIKAYQDLKDYQDSKDSKDYQW
jgi:hypothetical protein